MTEQVESAFITRAVSGIVSLFINTKDKWCNYHRYSDEEYAIGNIEGIASCIFTIDTSLLGLKEGVGVKYLRTDYQDKGQIVFMWIPYELLKKETTTYIEIEQ